MKLAVIGSRNFLDYEKLAATLDKVKAPITLLISGGAQGADSLAQRYAKERGLPILIYYPAYDKHPSAGAACAARNQRIVDEAEGAVVFWDFSSPGSRMFLDMMTKAGKAAKCFTVKI